MVWFSDTKLEVTAQVVRFGDNIKEASLGCFRHVQRRDSRYYTLHKTLNVVQCGAVGQEEKRKNTDKIHECG